MQSDTLTVNLGYLVNAGFTDKFGANTDADNQFAVKVLIQMGDADTVTANNATNYIYLSIKIGDIIVVGEDDFLIEASLLDLWNTEFVTENNCNETTSMILKTS